MAENDRSIATVVSAIVGDLQQIIRAEVRLAKVEVREEVDKAKRAAAFFVAAIVAFVLALAVAELSAVYALALVLPPWAAALAISVVTGLAATALAVTGSKHMRAVHLPPPRTLATLQENIQWAKTRSK